MFVEKLGHIGTPVVRVLAAVPQANYVAFHSRIPPGWICWEKERAKSAYVTEQPLWDITAEGGGVVPGSDANLGTGACPPPCSVPCARFNCLSVRKWKAPQLCHSPGMTLAL